MIQKPSGLTGILGKHSIHPRQHPRRPGAYIREIAEACGRIPPAARYRERMENHFMYGSNERIPEAYKALGDRA